MKTATYFEHSINRADIASYPNGITRRQVIQKLLDLLLTAAIGIGIAAILLFLIALA